MSPPATIFHRYRGVPSDDDYRNMLHAATHNVHIARQYLGVKLLTIGFMEALAEATGGDAPVSLFIILSNCGNWGWLKSKKSADTMFS